MAHLLESMTDTVGAPRAAARGAVRPEARLGQALRLHDQDLALLEGLQALLRRLEPAALDVLGRRLHEVVTGVDGQDDGPALLLDGAQRPEQVLIPYGILFILRVASMRRLIER